MKMDLELKLPKETKDSFGYTPSENKQIEKQITVQIVADKVTKKGINITGEVKGKLKIRVTPWAHVYVDGKPMGMTPLKPLELTVGEHIVQVKNERLREERSFRVVVKPNEVHSMEVNLLKKE